MTSSADLCREKGWGAGDLLCCSDPLPPGQAKFARLTAVGDTQVLGRPVESDGTEGSEVLLALLPHTWRRLTLQEWQSLQDTHPA